MNIYLIEKILKFKYLSNFVNKSNKTLCFYTFSLDKRSALKKDFKVLQVSKQFLKLFLTSSSILKWNWSLLFKGSLSIVSTFAYKFDLCIVEKFLKQNMVIGGFFRGIYFSKTAFVWFFSDLGKFITDSVSFRFVHLQKLLKNFYVLVISLYLVLYSFLKSFFFKLFNVYFNAIN